MVEVMKIMVTSLKRSHAGMPQSMPPTLQQTTTDPRLHQRLLDTHMKVSCGVTAPFSCILVHKVLFVPSRSLFPSPV